MTRGDSAKACGLLIHTSCGKLSSHGDNLARRLSPRCPVLCQPCSRPCYPHRGIARQRQRWCPAIATRSGVICLSSFRLATLDHTLRRHRLRRDSDRAIGRGPVGRPLIGPRPDRGFRAGERRSVEHTRLSGCGPDREECQAGGSLRASQGGMAYCHGADWVRSTLAPWQLSQNDRVDPLEGHPRCVPMRVQPSARAA
jgi:hypothetical protein